jgi:hypothetical protein
MLQCFPLPIKLPPYLVGAIDLQVGIPDPLDLDRERFGTSNAGAASFRMAL